jgi:hypothetical protein
MEFISLAAGGKIEKEKIETILVNPKAQGDKDKVTEFLTKVKKITEGIKKEKEAQEVLCVKVKEFNEGIGNKVNINLEDNQAIVKTLKELEEKIDDGGKKEEIKNLIKHYEKLSGVDDLDLAYIVDNYNAVLEKALGKIEQKKNQANQKSKDGKK